MLIDSLGFEYSLLPLNTGLDDDFVLPDTMGSVLFLVSVSDPNLEEGICLLVDALGSAIPKVSLGLAGLVLPDSGAFLDDFFEKKCLHEPTAEKVLVCDECEEACDDPEGDLSRDSISSKS